MNDNRYKRLNNNDSDFVNNDLNYSDNDNDDDIELEPLTSDSTKSNHNGNDSFLNTVTDVVPESDDPSMPALTFRVIVIGSIFVIIGAAFSQLMFFKDNSVAYNQFFVILGSHLLGKGMEKTLPKGTFVNPGPFNIKEHTLISVLATAGGTSAYASDILAISTLYFKRDFHPLVAIGLIQTTQFIGYGLVGLGYDILVKPMKMFWPTNLPTVSVLTSLHDRDNASKVDRKVKFFLYSFLTVFLYQIFPTMLMPTLTSVALLCFISKPGSTLSILGSGYIGYGIGDLSFDWSALSVLGPLYTPWDCQVNMLVGLIGMTWILSPILYFSNFWNAKSFPSPLSTGLFNSKFEKFDVQAVLNPDLTLNIDSWNQQKPLLLTPHFSVFYSFSFAAFTSTIIHVMLWYWQDIKTAMLSKRQEDIHNKLMEAYKPIPKSWYISTLIVTFILSAIICSSSQIQLPVWALALAILLSAVCLIPIGIIKAVSGISIGLNVFSELIIGYIIPGKPIANVAFKCFAYNSLSQAIDLTEDAKLGFYIKCPPRDVFKAQYLGTFIGGLVNYVVLNSVINAKRPYLDGTLVDLSGQYTGRSPGIFFTSSIVWGLVSPARFFTGRYSYLFIGFFVGIVVPFIPFLLHKRYPKPMWKYINFPIIFSGACTIPQYPSNIILGGAIAGYLSQVVARNRYPRWFSSKNYILSAALDAGTSVNALFAYITLPYLIYIIPKNWFLNPSGDAEHCIS